MDGKTHALVGAATAVVLTQPMNLADILFASSVGALGGLYCDVDIDNSIGSKILHEVLLVVSFGIAIIAGLVLTNNLPQMDFILNDHGLRRRLLVIACLIILATLGSNTPHRMVTHSLEFILLTSTVSILISNSFAVLFLFGQLSHVVLDVLNKKPVKLSLLAGLNLCFGVCKSSGKLSNLFAILAVAILVGYPGLVGVKILL